MSCSDYEKSTNEAAVVCRSPCAASHANPAAILALVVQRPAQQRSARCWRALTFAFRAATDGIRLLDPFSGLSERGSFSSRPTRAQGDETSIDDFEC